MSPNFLALVPTPMLSWQLCLSDCVDPIIVLAGILSQLFAVVGVWLHAYMKLVLKGSYL